MATTDISREAFDPRKHYYSVRMQQGRVIVDDDWNESERIENEDRRRARVDVIGPAGSPDTGFRVADATLANQQIAFDIEAGTFYLGGLRLEVEEKQPYRTQKDWLQGPDDKVTTPTAERVDLVYLEAYQQPVSAVEDSELFEVALGGPDTSTRVRTMQRARVLELENVKPDCCYAWGQLVSKLEGSLNEENELVVDTKLEVGYSPGGTPGDLCKPAVAGGYLGAENQAIRVQLVGKDKLTWGFDNASPLYRVQIGGSRDELTLITDPKDEAHWPLAGQTVEILPWAAVLPNNEKVAEAHGHLSLVKTSYDPDERKIVLKTAVPTAGFDDWASRSDASTLEKPRDAETPGKYYFMRVWDRGSDTKSDVAISFTDGNPVTLGETGLEVTIKNSDGKVGDYWIIAARPETPDEVVPWELEVGRPPHGVRRFYAPLALIHWKFKNGAFSEADVRDCRRTFRPLTLQKSCCTYTVGDGKASFGDFDSLEEALSHLPPSGGQICLLPGTHRANVAITGGKDIKITGCDKHTRVLPRAGKLADPVFQVVDSQSIILEHMDLVTLEGTAIVLEGTEPDSLREVDIRDNRILSYESGIRVRQGVGVSIHHNTIRVLDKEKAGVGIYMLADDSAIERNDIGVIPAEAEPPKPSDPSDDSTDPADPCAKPEAFYAHLWYLPEYLGFVWGYVFTAPSNPFKALGGVQIAGGSERVKVLENQIRGGSGNGVTLGSSLDLSALTSSTAAEEEIGEQEYKIRPDSAGIISGYAYSTDGKVLQRTPLSFQTASGEAPRSTITDEKGYFQVDVETPAGEYWVFASGYKVEGVDSLRQHHFVTFSESKKTDVNLENLIAFLHEVEIEGNTVSEMGLSGIGVPLVTVKELQQLVALAPSMPALYGLLVLAILTGTFAGFAVNLTVYRNRILRCLQNSFDARMRILAKQRGMGGISLGLCQNLVVRENRIEDNGTSHVDPTCGVFVSYADHVDIGHNQIVNNGPLVLSAGADLQKGFRGGVVLGLATSYPLLDPGVNLVGSSATGTTAAGAMSHFINLLKGRQAARVHDNVVEQPVGEALAMTAWGPVSIVNNQFNTDFASGLSFTGAVAVMNIGSSLGAQSDPTGATQLGTGILSGNTLFNNNQTCLAFAGSTPFSQAIVTQDDVGFDGNQSDVLGEQALMSNTVLWAATLRASDSRFKEPIGGAGEAREKLSLLTLSWFLNNTTDNQGNHCVLALNVNPAKPEVDSGNQALVKTKEECQAGKKLVQSLLGRLASIGG